MPRINFDGKFDGSGKQYLVELYKKGYPVIPTVDNINDVSKLPECAAYLLKPHNGLDGFGIVSLPKEQLKQHFNHNYVIQPKLDFVSEVQFYFVGNKLEYALEFSPSKVPVYPIPTIYAYTKKEQLLAQTFADLSPNYNGVQRIDFLKTNQGLLLLEIEDSSPYLDLESVSYYKRTTFIRDYKHLVYTYYQNFTKDAANSLFM